MPTNDIQEQASFRDDEQTAAGIPVRDAGQTGRENRPR